MKRGRIFVMYGVGIALMLFGWTSRIAAQESADKGAGPEKSPALQAEKAPDALSVDFDFKDADIKDIARAFSRISGVNIIVSDEVKARVTLHVQSMDWKSALKMIISVYNLSMLEKENYIVITTLERVRAEEDSGELKTAVITFNFIKVIDLKTTVSTMLSTRGKIETDLRTNSLVVTDIGPRIEKIKEVATLLDTKTPQVMIEMMMIDSKLTDEDKSGINWNVITYNTASQTNPLLRQATQTLGNSVAPAALAIHYGRMLGTFGDLSSLINLWAQEKKVEILANPRVLTLDNLAANIEIIEAVPYISSTTTDQGTVTSTQFKDTGIKLNVLPHITKDNFIFLTISTEHSFAAGFTDDSQPIVDSRKASTNVMVRDGETIVIGGLRKKEASKTKTKVPLLGDVPGLGKIFRTDVTAMTDTEIMVFITPHISSDVLMASRENMHLNKFTIMKTGDEAAFKRNTPFPMRPPAGKVPTE